MSHNYWGDWDVGPPLTFPKDPISVADDQTFDLWVQESANDGRTLAEFAANPIKTYPVLSPNRVIHL